MSKARGKVNDEASSSLIALFQSIGLPASKAAETAKSAKSAEILKNLIERYDLAGGQYQLNDKQASVLSALSIKLAKSGLGNDEKEGFVVKKILEGGIKSVDQMNEAVKFASEKELPFDEAEFDARCGVGFTITLDEIEEIASAHLKKESGATVDGWQNLSAVISSLKNLPNLRWANPLDVKNATEKAFVSIFGPKPANVPAKGGKPALKSKSPRSPDEKEKDESVESSKRSVFEEGFLGSLHKPGENPQLHPHLRDAHLAATGGQVWTRFPPEPNGYLHIGHSKAIFIDFGYAAYNGGKTYLRYDDTNPEKEEAQYFESILQIVRWLGYEPWKITYSSDYFDQLYELAVELIKRDKAYVCHCSQEQIKIDRGEGKGRPRACVHRDRPISESLEEFKRMKDGFYRPKEANLRMKQDLNDGNPQMWDLTAYRVLDAPHHRTGAKWKIYPTYDYTHCLVDSFENISHSLCTVEFVASRQSYEWLCDALEVYKPRQSEFGRLNLEGTITSKRKILALVEEGYVSGWDDPRLYTLIALRRRGVPPGAIISFVSNLGVSTALSSIEIVRFEHTIRQYLENTVPRLFMVLKPLKVTLENVPDDYCVVVEKSLHPKVPELGSTTIPFTKTLYIDADDFRLEDSKDYFRMAPGKSVGLFQAPYPVTCTSYKTDASGQVTEVLCRLENDGQAKKPKAFIQWVPEHAPSNSPVRIKEVRFFHRLFKSDNPTSGDFRNDINPNSLDVFKDAMIEPGIYPLAKKLIAEARVTAMARTEAALAASGQVRAEGDDTPVATVDQLVGNECVRFQALRVGYFVLDKDSQLASISNDQKDAKPTSEDVVILNRIVSLKEDSGKN